jgi:hypothetical protein
MKRYCLGIFGIREPLCSLPAGRKNYRGSAVVSHISRKTSEMWGTHWSVAREKETRGPAVYHPTHSAKF